MLSNKSAEKSIRSHSVHVAVERDYNRKKRQQKHEIKQEKDFLDLERKITSTTKRSHPIEPKTLTPSRSGRSLEEFMRMEKMKEDKMINSKKLANDRIRRN
ncbi:hypothetical protein I4U23_001388 [Adineta vaga]|nr:hypothetical protein I4U23_001388 [Adineta vaga]